ncbi:MAG TPA: GNAT family N-acetyltransferase [Kofleriaceae bacterium]|nr:GNAT family N-acetyltransferase [Kofleriaceae bacterium]
MIRRPTLIETVQVRALVQAVVDEIYGGMWAPAPLPIGDDDWTQGWIAIVDGAIVGVTLTTHDFLDDLWVAHGHRDRGIGAALLAVAEREIIERGHRSARLNVIAANARARRFYAHHGWSEVRPFTDERIAVDKIEMAKVFGVPRSTEVERVDT